MARNRSAGIRPLSDEQEAGLGSGLGILLIDKPGETNLETLVRVFGSVEAASTAWYAHRDALLAHDPSPGRRPPGFWLFELQREPPPVVEQAALLRELGELTEAEEQTLAEWRTPAPEIPDISIDTASAIEAPLFTNEIASADPGIRAVEDNHANDIDGDIDAAPESARPQAEVVEASTEDEAVEAEEHQEIPMMSQILPMRRGIDDRRPPETVGWETS